MPLTSGKRAFLEILKQEGVEYLFGNPGTTELPLMDGLVEEPALTYVLGLQEAAVVAMADGTPRPPGSSGSSASTWLRVSGTLSGCSTMPRRRARRFS